MMPIDQVRLNFNPASLTALNIILGFVMFGVALDMKLADFRNAWRSPKPILIGLFAQFVLLPAATFGLVWLIRPAPSIALGMFLVASCPGGNISNFLTHLARGNTALSVSMTAVSTFVATFMTPLNFSLWAGLYAPTQALLRDFTLDRWEMLLAVFLLLGLPMSIGLFVSQRFPAFSHRLKTPMRYLSIAIFGLFVIGALAANFRYFLDYVGYVVFFVMLQNGAALFSGYAAALLSRLPEGDRRAVAIEVGIQNSGLGLILIFNFFDGLGGMAIIAAWWGIWHILSGLSVAFWWRRRAPGPRAQSGAT
ncbi:MAG: bile acid:sodium symporter family protein [Leptospirales bacterium]|nr:bile acid:sodium symporter family protein [Leptospirales bacterium]